MIEHPHHWRLSVGSRDLLVCRKCHDCYYGAAPILGCTVADEPVRAASPPNVGELLDRALRGRGFDDIDRRFRK